jgi:hypothetical protein
MSDDETDEYLWEKRGPVDPELARLETLLGRYRLEREPLAAPEPARRFTPRRVIGLAAGLAAAGILFWAFGGLRSSGYRVIGVEGRELVRAGERFSTSSRTRGSRSRTAGRTRTACSSSAGR